MMESMLLLLLALGGRTGSAPAAHLAARSSRSRKERRPGSLPAFVLPDRETCLVVAPVEDEPDAPEEDDPLGADEPLGEAAGLSS